MSNRLLLLSSVLLLGSCAYALDKEIQDIKITTPGAQGSVCYVYVDGLRYRVHPPQTININNTKEDLIVDCLAPGNRRKKVVIEPQISKDFYKNAANGFVIGGAVDSLSGAMYKFPPVIEVDFTHTPIVAEKPPAQNAPDIKQPEEYVLEEFLPSSPRLNSDIGRATETIERKERYTAPQSSYVDDSFNFDDGASYSGKGNLDDVAPSINPPIDMNPSPAPAPALQAPMMQDGDAAPVNGPVQLLPEAQY